MDSLLDSAFWGPHEEEPPEQYEGNAFPGEEPVQQDEEYNTPAMPLFPLIAEPEASDISMHDTNAMLQSNESVSEENNGTTETSEEISATLWGPLGHEMQWGSTELLWAATESQPEAADDHVKPQTKANAPCRTSKRVQEQRMARWNFVQLKGIMKTRKEDTPNVLPRKRVTFA